MTNVWRWRWLVFLFGTLPSAYLAWENIDCGDPGVVTAPLCRTEDLSWFLLTAALILSWWRLRLAAIASVIGVLLSVPLYAYRIAPGMYDWTGIPRCCSTEFWEFNRDGIEGALAAALTLCVSGFTAWHRRKESEEG